MLEGTEREVLELLLERPHSPTEIADELGVSVQTASRNLKKLVDQEFAERTREGEGRGYKRYRAIEFGQVFAVYDGELANQTIELTETHRAVFSILRVPQPEFHPVLFSWLFFEGDVELVHHARAIIIYGSVARGDATKESDIDILVVYSPNFQTADGEYHIDFDKSRTSAWWGGPFASGTERVVSQEWFTLTEFHDALDAGSQFLRNVLDEGITLYDPEGVIRDAKRERAGERVSQ